MMFFRSCTHVFRLALVFIVCAMPIPATAQGQAIEEAPLSPLENWLALEDFSDVEIPSKFGFQKNFTWGAKALFSHKDVKEIVPVSAYMRNVVCDNENQNYTSKLMGALVFIVDKSSHKNTANAFWSDSLSGICSLDSNDPKFLDNLEFVDNSGVYSSLIDHLSGLESESNQFIFTVGNLQRNNKVIEPSSEYWLRCRDDQPPAFNSVCQATLAVSPYRQHKILASEARQN